MKVWLGVIGRACIEFAIILALVAFTAGAVHSVAAPSSGMRAIYESAASAALRLVPLAAIVTLFLAFFSFELRVKSRGAGWLGLFLLGAFLFSFGIGAQRIPLLRETIAGLSGGPASGAANGYAKSAGLIPPGAVVQQGRIAVWIGSFEGGEAVDAVAVDFGTDYPRLAYAPRAEIDPGTGDAEIQGRTYRTAIPVAQAQALVPEASIFAGSWIWDRLAAMTDKPLTLAFAMAGGFLFLAIGFRFVCRLSGWPLANAFFAVAGLAGLIALDAILSGSAILGSIESLLGRFGLSLPGPLLLAGIEGLGGIILGVTDLAVAPRRRKRLDE
jgi:hypothetical protein